MVREELIDGAVTFLQDPSVSSAPHDQKVSFLKSKNLTQEEIDASLARVGQPPASQSSHQTPIYPPPEQHRQPPPQYGSYQQQPPYWARPPPEAPQRDWRDWFIMATVMGGASYAVYWTAKRYIMPLIAPPTPPQIEQDKASIDASFDKAFALLDQLATDTQELKDAETARKERLDSALAEVEGIIGKMKEANESRDSEARRMARDIEEIKEAIPQAIQKEKETTEGRLKDLGVEMKSLKTLVGNRMGQPQRPAPPYGSQQGPNGVNGINGASAPSQTPAPAPVQNPASSAAPNQAAAAAETNGANGAAEDGQKPASVLPDRSSTASPYSRMLGGKAQIPSWQLAAKKRNEEAKNESVNGSESQNTSESGTVATPGESEAGA